MLQKIVSQVLQNFLLNTCILALHPCFFPAALLLSFELYQTQCFLLPEKHTYYETKVSLIGADKFHLSKCLPCFSPFIFTLVIKLEKISVHIQIRLAILLQPAIFCHKILSCNLPFTYLLSRFRVSFYGYSSLDARGFINRHCKLTLATKKALLIPLTPQMAPLAVQETPFQSKRRFLNSLLHAAQRWKSITVSIQ